MIQQRVIQYIEKEHLFSLNDKILVALSGGADSVALLCVLHTAGYPCEAAHCNFHLRGEESNRDELEVKCQFSEVGCLTVRAENMGFICILSTSTPLSMQQKNGFR